MSNKDDDDDDAGLFVVPKFTSFKSTTRAPLLLKPEKEKEKDSDERRVSKDRKRKHRDERRSHTRDEDRESRRRRKHRTESLEPIAAIETRKRDTENTAIPASFVIDVKGDPLIRKYGGVNRWQVAAYRRHGYGRVLGSERRLLVLQEGSRQVFSLLLPGERSIKDRFGLRSKHAPISKRNIRLKRARHIEQDKEEEADGYLSLTTARKRKTRKADDAESSADEHQQPSYKSIHGKAKIESDVDSDEEEEEEDGNSDQENADALLQDATVHDPVKWRSIQLNRQVKEHPEHIDAWFELVEHQDTLMRDGRHQEAFSENEAHSYSEIKVSMLESALSHSTSPEDRERVLVALMREGPKVWSTTTSIKRWTEYGKEKQTYDLWRARLEFSMTNVTQFQFETIKDLFLARLSLLRGIVISTSNSLPALEEAIDLLLRCTRFIYDSGYRELAVAVWQGIIELSLFRPEREEIENSEAIPESFRDFWESEAPRFGDVKAEGWKKFIEDGSLADAPDSVTFSVDMAASSSRDVYKAWGLLESNISEQAKLPARTLDEGTEDDPFRVVMYNDIEAYLFIIPSASLQFVSAQLIDAFLIFSGCLPVFKSNTLIEKALCDPLLAKGFISCREQKLPEADLEEVYKRQPVFVRDCVNLLTSPATLFPGNNWFGSFESLLQNAIINAAWMTRAIGQLASTTGSLLIAEYYLGMVNAVDSPSLKKAAKSLLKRHSGQSRLFSAYALAEFSNNNPEVAEKILASAASSPQLMSGADGILLCHTWTTIKLQLGKISAAKRVLCSVNDSNLRDGGDQIAEISPTQILKTSQTLHSGFDDYIRAKDGPKAALYAETLLLLTYLTTDGGREPTSSLQGNIDAAMDLAYRLLDKLKGIGSGGKLSSEMLVQFASQLLYWNATKGPFRRSYMQEQLLQFGKQFPRNTILLSLFEWTDMGLRIVDDTRSLLESSALTPREDCISSRIFAIQHESIRGNVHSTRSAFEHALRSDACRSNPWLWLSYMQFCSSNKLFRSKLQDVFFRALKHCPWSKDVAMAAFVILIRDMQSSDVRAVYSMMTSKGLRVHVDLDEYLDKKGIKVSSITK